MLNIMKKANAILNKVFTGLSVALLAVVIVATALQVFTRYIMNASLSGTDEVARFAFVWMSMMGASLCVRNHGHAVVSVLNDSLKNKPKAQAIHSVAVQILIMIGAAVLVVCGIQLVIATGEQSSAGLGIPISYTYACIPVGGAGMVINSLVNI